MATAISILVLGGLLVLLVLAIRQTKTTRKQMVQEIEETTQPTPTEQAPTEQVPTATFEALKELVEQVAEAAKTAEIKPPAKKRRGRPGKKKNS